MPLQLVEDLQEILELCFDTNGVYYNSAESSTD